MDASISKRVAAIMWLRTILQCRFGSSSTDIAWRKFPTSHDNSSRRTEAVAMPIAFHRLPVAA